MHLGEYCLGDEYRNAHMSKIEQDEKTVERMRSWIANPNRMCYFCGNVGTGKTYFAAAWYNYLKENNKNVRIYTEQLLFSHLMCCMNQNIDPHYELSRLCECENFILDDMGSSKNSEWKGEMYLSFVNYRSSNGKPTLITSNLNFNNLRSNYHERLVSRIYSKNNTVIELDGPDRRLPE